MNSTQKPSKMELKHTSGSIIFLLILVQSSVSGGLNLTEYYEMPKMYKYEPYDQCLNAMAQHEAVYCMVNAVIAPNSSNPTWNIIQTFSSDVKRHFKHDRITRGMCMNWCRKKIMQYSKPERKNYYLKSNTSQIDQLDPNSFHNTPARRAKYQEMANICMNLELKSSYDLLAETSIEYCISNRDVNEYDTLDEIFLLLIACLLLLIGASSTYDYYLHQNSLPDLGNNEHYKKSMPGKYTMLLVSFSLMRSWYRLIANSHDEVARDLRPLNAIRFLVMYGVVLAHICVVMGTAPENPEFIENLFHGFWTMLMINGGNILQVYFAITGFLLTIQFMVIREKALFNWSILWKSIIYRFLRYAPLYVFILFLSATWLAKLQDGPFWPRAVEVERKFCRENWWTNILFINNFVHANQPCAQHAWYLAADLQLVILGSMLHILLWRFPKFTREILGSSVILSFIAQGYVIYVNKFEGIFMASPETQRYLFLLDESYLLSYIPFYMNAGSFVLGLLGGIIYCEFRKGNLSLHNNKILFLLWHSIVPSCMIGLLTGSIFINNDFEKPALWIVAYYILIRNMCGYFLPILVIGIATGIGWIVRDILRLPIFRTLGRLTFAAYIVHPLIIRLCSGSTRTPFSFSYLKVIETSTSIFIFSYLAAVILALTIEIPLSSIQKTVFRTEKLSKSNSEDGKCPKDSSLELSTKNTIPPNKI